MLGLGLAYANSKRETVVKNEEGGVIFELKKVSFVSFYASLSSRSPISKEFKQFFEYPYQVFELECFSVDRFSLTPSRRLPAK